jgi:hypothetical protein
VAMAAAVSGVIVDGLVVPFLVHKRLQLPFLTFLRRAYARPSLVAALQVGAAFAVRQLGPPHNWFELAVQGAVAVALFGTIVIVVGVTPEERQRFVLRPLLRLLGRQPSSRTS